ncbi:MAG: arylamine N-acetyltransferase [Ruminococcus sp.]|nr:arylamine N-acetyltransferase [Ruminococcus sp.]
MCGVGPNARFRDRANLNMRTKNGSVSLTGRELSVVENHQKTVTVLEDDNEYMDAMKKIFGVDIREEFENLKK